MAERLSTAERQQLISKWISPSTEAEADRQARAERMVKDAIAAHGAFDDVRSNLTIVAKGSYPNNTNVRSDSDVDIKVQLNSLYYYDFAPGVVAFPNRSSSSYTGRWTPTLLRQEVGRALVKAFGSGVDDSHNVAFYVPPVPGSRPNVDVVPCFEYRLFTNGAGTSFHTGSVVYCRDSGRIVNWPELQLAHGRTKNTNTGKRYKFVVRVLKSVENELCWQKRIEAVPSYFSECLIYNVPDHVLKNGSFDDAVRLSLGEVYAQLGSRSEAMMEPNEIKKLFGPQQKWTVETARELVEQAWVYLGYGR
ncbi:nucleotidyltransferase [Streptomyces vilmorinianum]|uniref:nucleotidyltransferase n=1 Tax=Streptomyces vilmorinianum TaxID=3051092 RepID=UPI0010FB6E04|nr:nucleotidyltransferase [Streptomyces vilmorinianum]